MLAHRGKLYPLACLALAAFAFIFNWGTGHRGVFLLDQSIIFDGGYRILQGQTPYKDFLIPFGPVTFYIQALFFQLFGVNWTATVLPACLLNVLATLSVIRIVRLLSGGSRLLALCGGLATALCFQAPFGTLWLEQTSMFFDLLSLQAVVEALQPARRHRLLWQFGSGCLLAVAILSKQNYGVFFLPIIFAVLVAGELPGRRQTLRSLLLAGLGLALTIALFLGWVRVASDFASFVQRTLVVAGEIGRERLGLKVLAKALTFSGVSNLVQVDLLAFFAGALALLLAAFNLRARQWTVWREMAPAALIALLTPAFRSLALASTWNEWQNTYAFVGLAVCLAVSLGFRIIDSLSLAPAAGREPALRLPSARSVKIGFALFAALWSVPVLGHVGSAGWQRVIQQFEDGARFREPVRVPGMERVLWGDPTKLNSKTNVLAAEFEQVASYLAANRTPFFVMGDSTLLYGLLGTQPPQPLVYFQTAHSFLKKEIPHLDEIISASLERHQIGIVVREKVTYQPVIHDAYPLFPRTWSWFQTNFEHVTDFGNYEIWQRRPANL